MNEKKIVLLAILFIFSATNFCKADDVNKTASNKITETEKTYIKIDEEHWKLPSPECAIEAGKKLVLRKAKSVLRVTSKAKYRYATLEMEVRFGCFEKGIHYYIGFMSRDPWAKNVVWLNNDGSNIFYLRTAKNGQGNTISASATPKLETNKWYKFRIEWKPGAVDRLERRSDTVAFYLDDRAIGTYGDFDTMPESMIPVVFDAASQTPSEAVMEVRNIQITSHGKTVKQATLSKEIPVPPPLYEPDNPIVLQNPSAKVQEGKGIIENGFLHCEIDLKSLSITHLLNKYIKDEVINGSSRLFVINAQGNDIPNSDYELLEAKASSYENKAELYVSWQSKKNSLKVNLNLYIKRDSQEMLLSLEAQNLGTELLTLGITAPFIEHIKIGDEVEDDYYFYPMMTGWCGKLPARMRNAYGYMAYMQLLAVFDPVVGGGVFTYTLDAEGMPKNLIVNKRHHADEDPVPNNTSGFSDEDPGEIFSRIPSTAMAVRHLRYELKSGQSCNPPKAIIGVSHGDWHDSFNHYKHWVRSWFHKGYKLPRWFRDNYDYISQHPHGGAWPTSGFMDKPEKKYVYAERMGDSEVGTMTEWAFWWEYPENVTGKGQAANYAIGDYDYSERRGGLKAFRKEINRIHEKGGRIQLYTNPNACWKDSRIGRTNGAEYGRKNRNGNYTYDWVEPGLGYNPCGYVEGWHQHMSERMAIILKETGADSYRLDVSALIYPCYNSLHEHYDGTIRSAVSPKAMGRFMETCSSEARKANPDAVIMTEHAGNEFTAQFIDSYLTQQFRWDSPFFAPFRGMSAYNLVFMRFLLPEVKTLIFGFDPEEGGRRALFNGLGQDRGDAQGEVLRYMTRTHRLLSENGDAIEGLHPEPLIPTLQDGLMANAFPGKNKRIWTLCNRNSKPITGELLAVEVKDNTHYVEILHDTPLSAMTKNDKTIVSGRIELEEVICIAELPKTLKVQLDGKKLKVNIDKQEPEMHVEFFAGDDDQNKASRLFLQNGRGEVEITSNGKVIVKLIKDKYLLDQVVILDSNKCFSNTLTVKN